MVAQKYSKSSHTLRPRLVRTCLKHFLDPTKPLGANYGGIVGLQKIGGPEVVRVLIVPNLKVFESLVREEPGEEETKKVEKGIVVAAIWDALMMLEGDSVGVANGLVNGDGDALAGKLREKIGDLIAAKVLELGKPNLVRAILET